MNYENIFKPGKIGKLALKNRIVMPGMSTSLGGAFGEINDHVIRYYEERAKGGTGLIITEFTTIDYELGRGAMNQLRIDHDRFITGFYRLANAVHKYGAKIFVQLHHAGRQGNSLLTDGKQIVAPSPVMCKGVGEQPRELTTAEVKELVQKFIAGAVRAKTAGVDGVEVHGAHGYLINQFLSPKSNIRTDEYGGSFENRMRFLKEIVVGIKEKCGQDFPVTVRLSVDEFDEGGQDVSLSKEICRYLEAIGVDGIHASCGNYNSMETIIESPLYEEGWRVYLAEEMKKVVKIPVITVGNIRDPKYVDSIIGEGKADFVAIGRGHIADPEWVRKVEEGREKEIRMCTSCLHCLYSKGHLSCSINARAGRELEFSEFPPAKEKHRVVIVGGGPGGIEAARVLTIRGFEVILLEKTDRLGGQLNLVTDPIYKKKMDRYVRYLCNEMDRLNVDIRLNTEATVDMVKSLNPYAVILATGGKPYIPVDMEGYDLPNVCNYRDVKIHTAQVQNQKVIVIGSGMVCQSTSRRLNEAGNDVTYVEVPTRSGSKISPPTRKRLIKKLRNENVEVITGHKVVKIVPTGVVLEEKGTGKISEITADQVVIAMGIQAYNPLEDQLKGEVKKLYTIGDAAGFLSLSDAVRGGFDVAYTLE